MSDKPTAVFNARVPVSDLAVVFYHMEQNGLVPTKSGAIAFALSIVASTIVQRRGRAFTTHEALSVFSRRGVDTTMKGRLKKNIADALRDEDLFLNDLRAAAERILGSTQSETATAKEGQTDTVGIGPEELRSLAIKSGIVTNLKREEEG